MDFLAESVSRILSRMDPQLLWLVGGTVSLLALATVIGWGLGRRPGTDGYRNTIENLNQRISAWRAMTAVFGVAVATGGGGALIMFALTSFFALREFITLTPTRRGDHRALFWAFFVVVPLQYVLLAVEFLPMFSIFIPVYVFLILPIRSAAAGDTDRFLERTAKLQWGLMICVYCLSHASAISVLIDIPDYDARSGKLLYYFVLICELSDVLQYVFGKLFGRHTVAPTVCPGKTWEGLIGGVTSTVLICGLLHGATPFTFLQALWMSLAVCLMGFGGGLVMSAIKRDRGVKDWGHALAGHGGVLDRIDSLCFAAPVFYHLTRYYYGQ
jgi:phosphatidate cytidylyltransferase